MVTPIGELTPRLDAVAATAISDAQAVRAGALALENLLLGEPAQYDEHFVERVGGNTIKRLQDLYERFETNLEYEFAGKILSGEASVEDYPLYERFQRLVQAEAALAEMKPTDKVLFIGGGPFPISPILYARLAGASADCLDSSVEACNVSQKVVHQLGLGDKLTIINADGRDPAIGEYDAVVVALLARPKFDICFNVKWRNPEDTPVIVRYVEGDRQAFYKGLDNKADDRIIRYSLAPSYRAYHAGQSDVISSRLMSVRKSIEKI